MAKIRGEHEKIWEHTLETEGKSSKMRDFHGFSSHDYQRLLGLRYVVHPRNVPHFDMAINMNSR